MSVFIVDFTMDRSDTVVTACMIKGSAFSGFPTKSRKFAARGFEGRIHRPTKKPSLKQAIPAYPETDVVSLGRFLYPSHRNRPAAVCVLEHNLVIDRDIPSQDAGKNGRTDAQPRPCSDTFHGSLQPSRTASSFLILMATATAHIMPLLRG